MTYTILVFNALWYINWYVIQVSAYIQPVLPNKTECVKRLTIHSKQNVLQVDLKFPKYLECIPKDRFCLSHSDFPISLGYPECSQWKMYVVVMVIDHSMSISFQIIALSKSWWLYPIAKIGCDQILDKKNLLTKTRDTR